MASVADANTRFLKQLCAHMQQYAAAWSVNLWDVKGARPNYTIATNSNVGLSMPEMWHPRNQNKYHRQKHYYAGSYLGKLNLVLCCTAPESRFGSLSWFSLLTSSAP